MKDFHVVEWSPSQKGFHVETVGEMLRDNISVFLGRTMTDYVPIGIFRNKDELDAFMKKAYETLK
jgi:hypothetical protein